jgi:hypothetical protein
MLRIPNQFSGILSAVVPLGFQISKDQQQVICKMAEYLRPFLGSYDCVLLILILRKDGVDLSINFSEALYLEAKSFARFFPD